jgi:hypothetical protein
MGISCERLEGILDKDEKLADQLDKHHAGSKQLLRHKPCGNLTENDG